MWLEGPIEVRVAFERTPCPLTPAVTLIPPGHTDTGTSPGHSSTARIPQPTLCRSQGGKRRRLASAMHLPWSLFVLILAIGLFLLQLSHVGKSSAQFPDSPRLFSTDAFSLPWLYKDPRRWASKAGVRWCECSLMCEIRCAPDRRLILQMIPTTSLGFSYWKQNTAYSTALVLLLCCFSISLL